MQMRAHYHDCVIRECVCRNSSVRRLLLHQHTLSWRSHRKCNAAAAAERYFQLSAGRIFAALDACASGGLLSRRFVSRSSRGIIHVLAKGYILCSLRGASPRDVLQKNHGTSFGRCCYLQASVFAQVR